MGKMPDYPDNPGLFKRRKYVKQQNCDTLAYAFTLWGIG